MAHTNVLLHFSKTSRLRMYARMAIICASEKARPKAGIAPGLPCLTRSMINSSLRFVPASFGPRPAARPPCARHHPHDVANMVSPSMSPEEACGADGVDALGAKVLPDVVARSASGLLPASRCSPCGPPSAWAETKGEFVARPNTKPTTRTTLKTGCIIDRWRWRAGARPLLAA